MRCIIRVMTAVMMGVMTLVAALATAHPLEENTARITLRDGNLEVRLDVDLDGWIRALRTAPESNASSQAPTEAQRRLEQHLIEQTHVLVDDAPVLFTKLRVQPLDQTAHPQASRHPGPTATFLLEAACPVARPATVQITLPATLGPTVVNFVQPTTRWTAPGATNTFAVLHPAGTAPSTSPLSTSTPSASTSDVSTVRSEDETGLRNVSPAIYFGVGLGVGAIASAWFARRRSRGVSIGTGPSPVVSLSISDGKPQGPV